MSNDSDKVFAGSIPELYDAYLIPLIFEQYAADLADRLTTRRRARVLEIAAGTGVLSRAMVSRRDLSNGGFAAAPEIVTLAARSRAESCRIPATAYCQGTPLRNEIEARDASRLGEATEVAAEAIARKFGRGPVDGKIQAHMIIIES